MPSSRIKNHFADHGFGWWAVQVPGGAPTEEEVLAAIDAGCAQFGEIVSFKVPDNRRSIHVMQRDPAGDFDRPALAEAIRCAATCSIAAAAREAMSLRFMASAPDLG